MMSNDEMASKRLRSNSFTKPTSSDMSVAELAKLMESQLSSFQRSTRDDIKKLGDSLSNQMSQLRTDISLDLEKLRDENIRSYNDLATTIDQVKTEHALALDRSMRSNDLIATGVPYVRGEDLTSYFHAWCHSLGYDSKSIPLVDIRRMVKGALVDGKVYVILMQFAINVQRNDFFSRYLRSRSLSLANIGFSVNKRIFINESLGLAARKLRSKAQQLKKDGKLHSVFSRDGIVYIRKAASDPATAVYAENVIEMMLNQ